MMECGLLLKAFSSGCTDMTGVEALSNGVKAFRETTAPTAQRKHISSQDSRYRSPRNYACHPEMMPH